MVYTTKGIVLRTVPYGDSSVIATLYTELFGLESYIINGIRSNRKSSVKGNLFQPSALLELEAYHNELKKLQRIKEARWHYLYQQLFFSVPKNAVALFITELLQKVIKQPEHNPGLYHFIEDAYIQLDSADVKVTAGYPLFFALNLAAFFGFSIRDDYSPEKNILDLSEGEFVCDAPMHPYFIQGKLCAGVSQMLKVMQPRELHEVSLSHSERRQMLDAVLQFYSLHIQDFGMMKTLPVLQEVLS
ncbi:MAG: DNA repair protein RecO [Chitinophagaceae bacterium]|nr:DNA repair protein RecO [Chitinophagaceae bacterium]